MSSLFSNLKVRAALVVLLILVVLGLLLVVTGRAERIAPNPPGTVGNTAGNLNNGGYFCEYNGVVYFANPYDKGALYSMDASEGQLKKLSSVRVCNLLAGGKYLYYFQLGSSGEAGLGNVRSSHSFNRCGLNGKHAVSLTRDIVVTGQLVDDYLYLLTAGEDHPVFYKLKTDKSDRTDLANYTVNPACAANGIIYYNGTQNDHYLYALDTSNDVSSEVWAGNLWYPALDGDYIYYMDVENNYRICRYSLSQGVVEVLTNDRADCFNVGYGYIYYQTNGTHPQLMCMRTDGTDVKVVAEGIYTDISLTSQYAYFRDFSEEASLYHSYLGSDYMEVFYGAMEAALEK